jgi:hypothetical protein
LCFWESKFHELDYVLAEGEFLEVKMGGASPIEFSWFPGSFPRARLKVINRNRFEASRITGLTLEDFLLEG